MNRISAACRPFVLLGCLVLGVFAGVARAEGDLLDRVDDALTSSALDGRFRTRLSGTVDLEHYSFQLPAPGLLRSTGRDLTSPRLSLFLDAQVGAQLYFFAQGRADRGFDPGDDNPRVRLDEYALRFTPWHDGRLSVQVGKFATVVGSWVQRHGSWQNPFIGAPLPYENLTGMWDSEAARSSGPLLQWSHVKPGLPAAVVAVEKNRRLPIIWGPSYATGVAVAGAVGEFRYAAELKNAALSSRPEYWTTGETGWRHPTVSGRIGYGGNRTWSFGVSASGGTYLRPSASTTLAPGHGFDDYRELVLGQDIGFAWRHLQLWAECFETRFEIPNVGDADTVAYYVEAKYKFTPQFFGALRWNRQVFGTIPDGVRGLTPWGRDIWRTDLAAGYRFTPHVQLKLQYSFEHETGGPRDLSHSVSGQFTVRF